jgi:hypothetical protein
VKIRYTIPFITGIIFLLGCQGKEPSEVILAPPVPEVERLPVDYLFIIDNSGSIPIGEPREYAREAIKAFVEFAEQGDRISLVAFGRRADMLVSRTIQDQQDRETIKKAAGSGLTFTGGYTNISSAFSLLKSQGKEIFRGKGFSSVVILLSDGKLEPGPGVSTRQAFQNIQKIVQESPGITFYSIGLGDKAIHEEFLPGQTGFTLLRDTIAHSTGGLFYHTRSVDELIDAYFKILKLTKGISESKETYALWADESTERLSTLVLKRTTSEDICKTRDIFIEDPNRKKIDFSNFSSYPEGQTSIRWQRGTYYDLVTVEKPLPGIWKIGLENGKKPRVISLLKTSINLRFAVRDYYWDKEKKLIIAWFYDERRQGLSDFVCEVNYRYGEDSSSSIPFTQLKNSLYLTLIDKKKAGEHSIQITAVDEDHFFYRSTSFIPFKIKESYFSFEKPGGRIRRWILGWDGVHFGTKVDRDADNYTPFRSEPEVVLHLDRLDEKGESHPLPPIQLERSVDGNKWNYSLITEEFDLGWYRGYFELKGVLNTGEKVNISSEDFSFELVRPGAEYAVFGLLSILLVTILFWQTRPRLAGELRILNPQKKTIRLKGHRGCDKSFKGDSLTLGKKGKELKTLKENLFKVSFKRSRKMVLEVLSGRLKVVRKEKETMVRPGGGGRQIFHDDEIFFTDSTAEYEVKIVAPRFKEKRKYKAKKARSKPKSRVRKS